MTDTMLVQRQPYFKVGIPFVATTGGFVRVRLCACLCAILSEHNLDDCNPHLPLIANGTYVHAVHRHPHSNERYKKQRTSHRLMYISCVLRNTYIPPFQPATPPGFSSQPHREGLGPTSPMQTLKVPYSFSTSVLMFLKYHSSCQRLGSHGTIATTQVIPFATATNGASVRL